MPLNLGALIDWLQGAATSPGALWLLLFVSFADASFFPAPPDFLLIPLCFLKPKRALLYALLTTLFSVLGALFGFQIGKWGGAPLGRRWFGKKRWAQAEELFAKYESLTVAVAALSPVPYKLATIATGALEGSLKMLLLISVLFRGFRFFAEALLMLTFGKAMQAWLFHNFDKVTLAITALLIIIFIFFKKSKKTMTTPEAPE